jgi:hypothetical protein
VNASLFDQWVVRFRCSSCLITFFTKFHQNFCLFYFLTKQIEKIFVFYYFYFLIYNALSLSLSLSAALLSIGHSVPEQSMINETQSSVCFR